MSELTLRFGEARLHVEGDADLAARERAAFLEHLGRLDRQSEKAGELLAVLLRAGRAPEKAEEPVSKKAEPEEPAEEKSATQDDLCRLRSIHVGFVSPSQLKRAKAEGKLDHLLAQRDEIEVPLDTGGTVTVVCCYVSPTSARFVFKDCWDEGVMNDEATNKTGYFKSKGRKHVLEDIYPRIAAEWREIIVPRTFVETIEGERVEYSDPLWLPSATDVFGTTDGAWWNDGDDDFQLPVFARERDRVKECGDKGTYSWWLRSVNASNTNNFCNVNTDGSANNNNAYNSNGFAPGFKNNLGPEQVANCEAVPQTLKENLTLGDWPAMRGLHSLNHHSIRRPGRFLHGRGFTAALPRLHEQPLCSYFKPLRQTTQVREVMRPANRAPDRTLYGWDTALEAT